MNENKVAAQQRTINYFKAYYERYCKRPPYKSRNEAVKVAWHYFRAFNGSHDPKVRRRARFWFEQNIGRLSQAEVAEW